MTELSAILRLVVRGSIVGLLAGGAAMGQGHQLFRTSMPTGEIGRLQIARRPELQDVFQPVLIKAPGEAVISVAEGAGFSGGNLESLLVSLQVGETYRLRVSGIPFRTGEVYPTIELIDRMHAPTGKETRYPIPIELTRDELEMALDGKFVTRVVYVEDPRLALPVRQLPEQRYLEVAGDEDPLHVADALGRPVAILRMGSLAPGSGGLTDEFLFGSPPLVRHAEVPAQPAYVPSPIPFDTMPADPVAPNLPQIIERETPPQGLDNPAGPLEIINPFDEEAGQDSARDNAPDDDLDDAEAVPFDPAEVDDLDDLNLDAEDPFQDF